MTMIAGQLEQEYPDTNKKMGVGLGGFQDWFTSDARAGLLMLLGAVGFLLLIVCSNVANLQLGRAAARRREIEIRKALGATRVQIVQQLAAESALLGLLGGAIGLLLAFGSKRLLLAFAPELPGAVPMQIDIWILIFALGVSLASALIFGIAPAYAASRVGALNERSRTGTAQNRAMRNVLVACEVALSVMLVSGAGLLVKSLIRLEHVSPGFQADRGLSFHSRKLARGPLPKGRASRASDTGNPSGACAKVRKWKPWVRPPCWRSVVNGGPAMRRWRAVRSTITSVSCGTNR